MMNQLEIKCSNCKCTLWVDATNGNIVDHKAAEHKKINLDDFIKSQKTRASDLEEQFKKAQIEKEKRKKKLEEDFLKAKENPDDLKGNYQSPFEWD